MSQLATNPNALAQVLQMVCSPDTEAITPVISSCQLSYGLDHRFFQLSYGRHSGCLRLSTLGALGVRVELRFSRGLFCASSDSLGVLVI